MNEIVFQAAEKFTGQTHSNVSVKEYGQGIIHDTFLVTLNDAPLSFILQHINKQIFKDPLALMENLRLVCDYISKRIQVGGRVDDADWQVFQIVPAMDGRDFFIDTKGGFWRALSFIDGADSLEQITSLNDVLQVGRGLGIFHKLVSGLDPGLLKDTLPGFHDVGQYLRHYDNVHDKRETDKNAKICHQFIEDRRSWAPVLENSRRENVLKLRVIHGDPKTNNIMIDRMTGKAVSIIDLDTVMPGLVQYDIGDCLRSCCNTAEEETVDLAAVRFDCNRCEAVLAGYTDAAHDILTDTDFDYFFDAIRLIPFELGLRFFTDNLKGDVYFKTGRQNQNLDRALVQFKLVESIEQQENAIRTIIENCRFNYKSSIT